MCLLLCCHVTSAYAKHSFLEKGQKQEDVELQDVNLSQSSYKHRKCQFLTKDQIKYHDKDIAPSISSCSLKPQISYR